MFKLLTHHLTLCSVAILLVAASAFGQIFTPGGPGSGPAIASGPDGNPWYTRPMQNTIARVTPIPGGITSGPDGNLWFTEYAGNKIGRISTAGAITEFPIATAASQPEGITTGPD